MSDVYVKHQIGEHEIVTTNKDTLWGLGGRWPGDDLDHDLTRLSLCNIISTQLLFHYKSSQFPSLLASYLFPQSREWEYLVVPWRWKPWLGLRLTFEEQIFPQPPLLITIVSRLVLLQSLVSLGEHHLRSLQTSERSGLDHPQRLAVLSKVPESIRHFHIRGSLITKIRFFFQGRCQERSELRSGEWHFPSFLSRRMSYPAPAPPWEREVRSRLRWRSGIISVREETNIRLVFIPLSRQDILRQEPRDISNLLQKLICSWVGRL